MKENSNQNIILVAGGSGFIGKKVVSQLEKTAEVRILSRQKNTGRKNYFYWNPDNQEIDLEALKNVTHIINLCGAGIADKRWTKTRIQELFDSRTVPAKFLASKVENLISLKQYISASGVNCYNLANSEKLYTEKDELGKDLVSEIVEKWEEGADLFEKKCIVLKFRIGFVISDKGGAVEKMEQTIKMGIGSALGSGKQNIPWIHLDDLVSLFNFAIENNLSGVYHAIAENNSNEEMTIALAEKHGKRIFMPKVPAFMLKLILGKLSVLVLEGIKASNQKILATGFKFQFTNLKMCFSKNK
jgi:hypothetical protein